VAARAAAARRAPRPERGRGRRPRRPVVPFHRAPRARRRPSAGQTQAYTTSLSGGDTPDAVQNRTCSTLAAWSAQAQGQYFAPPPAPCKALWGPKLHAYTPRPANVSDAPAFYKRLYALQARAGGNEFGGGGENGERRLGPGAAPASRAARTANRSQLNQTEIQPQGYRSTWYVGALLSLSAQGEVWAYAKAVADGLLAR
jgi:hypothetical protein